MCSSDLSEKHALYLRPSHPYTEALLSAIPIPDPKRERGKVIQLLQGDMPSPIDPPSGCVFRTRCPDAIASCSQRIPELQYLQHDHQVACPVALAALTA